MQQDDHPGKNSILVNEIRIRYLVTLREQLFAKDLQSEMSKIYTKTNLSMVCQSLRFIRNEILCAKSKLKNE